MCRVYLLHLDEYKFKCFARKIQPYNSAEVEKRRMKKRDNRIGNGKWNWKLPTRTQNAFKASIVETSKKKRYMCLYGLCYLWLTAEEWDQQTTKFIDINLPNGCFVGHKRILCTRLEGFSSSLACSNRLRIMRIELCKQKQNDF